MLHRLSASRVEDAYLTYHACDAIRRRGVDIDAVNECLLDPQIVRQSGERHIYTRDNLSVVVDLRGERITVVTALLYSREAWNDRMARAVFKAAS